jgi:Flp pilus assembly protein TadG
MEVDMSLLRRVLDRVGNARGQSTVEYALVMVAFLTMVVTLGAIWQAGRDGALLELAVGAASHAAGDGGLLGAARDIALF